MRYYGLGVALQKSCLAKMKEIGNLTGMSQKRVVLVGNFPFCAGCFQAGRVRLESFGKLRKFFLCCSDSDLAGSGAEHHGNFREVPGRIPASIKRLESHGSGRFRSGFLDLGNRSK